MGKHGRKRYQRRGIVKARKGNGKNGKKRTSDEAKPTMEETVETYIYFWFDDFNGEGHISIKLPQGVYISFRTNQPYYKIKVSQPFYPAKLSDDISREGREPDLVQRVPAGRLDQDMVLSWWNGYKKLKPVSLLKHQSSTVMYQALRAGGGHVQEPLYWTPRLLESYSKKLIQKKKNTKGVRVILINWFREMDFQSKIYFIAMVALLGLVVAMTFNRFSFTNRKTDPTHTCYNEYKPCKDYVKYHYGEEVNETPLSNLLSEDMKGFWKFSVVAIVMVVFARFSFDSLVEMLRGRKEEVDLGEENQIEGLENSSSEDSDTDGKSVGDEDANDTFTAMNQSITNGGQDEATIAPDNVSEPT